MIGPACAGTADDRIQATRIPNGRCFIRILFLLAKVDLMVQGHRNAGAVATVLPDAG
jgi:hypothetical protein